MAQLTQSLVPVVQGIWSNILIVWSQIWWIVVPLLALFLFWDFWIKYIQFKFIVSIQWVLLEIKVPKNILKTPKAMEQIFAAAHTPYSYGLRFFEEYWEGLVEYWMSFEIVGRAGETHFYLRVPKQYRNLMESAIYGQYPEAEITEVEDYVKQMAKVLPNKAYTLFGNEQILRAPNCYPLRTYPQFEESVEERRVDPIATLLEAASRLKEDEQIWIQIMARPTGDAWKAEGDATVSKITGIKRTEEKNSGSPLFGLTLGEIARAPFEHPSLEVKEEKRSQRLEFGALILTPGQREVVEGIERKISKLGFEISIRFLYIDRRDSFSRDNVASVMGFFRQFNTQNLNLLRPDKRTMTAAVHGLFKELRLNWRRRVLFERYRDLIFGPVKPILNIEELATIYHFPITEVSPSYLEKVESRKGGPPPSVPIIEE